MSRARERRPDYLRAVRALPCIAGRLWGGCDGPIEAHHAGKNPGMGMKATDETAVPLCQRHHRHITGIVGGYGEFRHLSVEERRKLQDIWVRDTQRTLSDVLTGKARPDDAY